MNIVYLSVLSGKPWAGPTYSVPKQIEAQSKIDNVLWYNQIHGSRSKWLEYISSCRKLPYYCDLEDYPEESIESLPKPFNNPDLIVVEQCYIFSKKKIITRLKKYNYIIIPRGEFTTDAQKQKWYKKIPANLLFYSRFVRGAKAIQFLTKEEQKSSSKDWNENQIVIANGTDPKEVIHKVLSETGIRCISIGRLSPFHKGIDLLIKACTGIKNELIENGCVIDIYGPDRENKRDSLISQIVDSGLDSVLFVHDALYGKEKDQELLNSDVFIMTSRFEGHPTALLDALSYGLPALVTTGSNMRNEIESNCAGWGADNDADSIQKAILLMLREKDSINLRSKNARLLSERYSWNALANESHRAYEEILRGR